MSGMGLKMLLLNTAANPFSDLPSMMQLGLRQKHDEFLAAIAGDRVSRPQLRLDIVGDPAQYVVPRRMSIRVIDPLEPVDVEEHAPQRMLVSARLTDFYGATVLEVSPIPAPPVSASVRPTRFSRSCDSALSRQMAMISASRSRKSVP